MGPWLHDALMPLGLLDCFSVEEVVFQHYYFLSITSYQFFFMLKKSYYFSIIILVVSPIFLKFFFCSLTKVHSVSLDSINKEDFS